MVRLYYYVIHVQKSNSEYSFAVTSDKFLDEVLGLNKIIQLGIKSHQFKNKNDIDDIDNVYQILTKEYNELYKNE